MVNEYFRPPFRASGIQILGFRGTGAPCLALPSSDDATAWVDGEQINQYVSMPCPSSLVLETNELQQSESLGAYGRTSKHIRRRGTQNIEGRGVFFFTSLV